MLTERRHVEWWPRVRLVGGALLIGFFLLVVFLVLKHQRDHNVLGDEVSTLRVENAELRRRVESLSAGLDEWTTDIDRFLSGKVIPALEKKIPPPRVEPWQLNRDKELREAMRRYQLQRMDLEARVLRLEREIR